jgi:peptidoglycan/LPS O-acetylase OafA/YrhL
VAISLRGADVRFLAAWFRIGWIGVDLFFVLSGFLISGLLFLEYRSAGELKLARFFLRRGLKIYPAFWAMLFASVLGLVLAGKSVRGIAIAGELLFVQNYTQSIWEHTWSLAVEEHFYLLLPLF